MKKLGKLLVLLAIILPTFVYAEEEDYYLISFDVDNFYYQRSQHTYSFKTRIGQYHDEYAPSLFALITDLDLASKEEQWDFGEKYKIPWDITDPNYVLVYCGDIGVNNESALAYRKIKLQESNYFNARAREGLEAVVVSSYPFISQEEMLNNLIAAGVLEYKNVGSEKILTAKANTNPTKSITIDELHTAIQTAIWYYTNPYQIIDVYFDTVTLGGGNILRNAGLWDNTYEPGVYDEVKNNITAVYEYLINLNSKDIYNLIDNAQITKVDDNYELKVVLNDSALNYENLKLKVYEDDNLLSEDSLVNLKNNNEYVTSLNTINNAKNVKLEVTGNGLLPTADIYELKDEYETSQVLIGATLANKEVSSTFDNLAIKELENPKTGILVKTISMMALIGIALVILKIKKTNKIYKI